MFSFHFISFPDQILLIKWLSDSLNLFLLFHSGPKCFHLSLLFWFQSFLIFPMISLILFYILLQVAVPIYVPYFYSLQQTTFVVVVVVVEGEHMWSSVLKQFIPVNTSTVQYFLGNVCFFWSNFTQKKLNVVVEEIMTQSEIPTADTHLTNPNIFTGLR